MTIPIIRDHLSTFDCVCICYNVSYKKQIINMRKRFEDFSEKLTRWIGSPQSILVHTIFFLAMFCLYFFNISSSNILLILTTVVSLEAIYLSIFIQMSVNRHSQELEEVSEGIEEIQEDVDEIQKDVDEIQEVGELCLLEKSNKRNISLANTAVWSAK